MKNIEVYWLTNCGLLWLLRKVANLIVQLYDHRSTARVYKLSKQCLALADIAVSSRMKSGANDLGLSFTLLFIYLF